MASCWNRDDDMAHTIDPGDPDARQAFLSGRILASTSRARLEAFFERNPDLRPRRYYSCWAGPGTTLWHCAVRSDPA